MRPACAGALQAKEQRSRPRSLADFAKMVEVFDAQGVSFVSVTQQFNTTTSMGRLTLNVLLSFAQFEREVTGERIRDKIAASGRKGLLDGRHRTARL
ncbi:MAG: recombinase family protein [Candidatus Binatus sp.]|nr:recombinase family protein [Candidatus Binatus sp.]MDO8433720.1 recombinase family protein [Candidatus Binatus sp.]